MTAFCTDAWVCLGTIIMVQSWFTASRVILKESVLVISSITHTTCVWDTHKNMCRQFGDWFDSQSYLLFDTPYSWVTGLIPSLTICLTLLTRWVTGSIPSLNFCLTLLSRWVTGSILSLDFCLNMHLNTLHSGGDTVYRFSIWYR